MTHNRTARFDIIFKFLMASLCLAPVFLCNSNYFRLVLSPAKHTIIINIYGPIFLGNWRKVLHALRWHVCLPRQSSHGHLAMRLLFFLLFFTFNTRKQKAEKSKGDETTSKNRTEKHWISFNSIRFDSDSIRFHSFYLSFCCTLFFCAHSFRVSLFV